jgi:enoyl-CoA hydratase/carnithine racemase
VIADRRLYLERTGSRLVAENDPEAAFLLIAKGHEIPAADVKRLGLVVHEGRVMQASQVPQAPLAEKAPESVANNDMMAQGVSPAPMPEPEAKRIWPSQVKRKK